MSNIPRITQQEAERRGRYFTVLGVALGVYPEVDVLSLEYEISKDPTGVYECETVTIIRRAAHTLERVDVTGLSLAAMTAEVLREVGHELL